MEQEYLRQKEMLSKLSMTKGTFRKLISLGMPYVQLPSGSRRYRWKDVDDWLQQYTRQQTDKAKKVLEEILS